jgi:hypothetical protein
MGVVCQRWWAAARLHRRGSFCSSRLLDTSSTTPTALRGSVPLGSAAANIALALALALREPPPVGTLAVHRYAMITHPRKASWSSLMQAEGIPDQLHQRSSSGILGRREHVSCTTTTPLGSWSCSWAGTFVRCQIIKRGSNSGSFSACSSWRAASGPGDVLCRCWAGCKDDSGGNFGIDSSIRLLSSLNARSRKPAGVHHARKITLHSQPHSSILPAQNLPHFGVVLHVLRDLTQLHLLPITRRRQRFLSSASHQATRNFLPSTASERCAGCSHWPLADDLPPPVLHHLNSITRRVPACNL